MTSLAIEQQEQRRWQLLPHCAALTCFDELVAGEFLPPAALRQAQDGALKRTLRFAAEAVPYYRERWRRPGRAADDVRGCENLPLLPLLTRADLQEHFERLKPAALPPGERSFGLTRTSGSTGQRVSVAHTWQSMFMANVLKQRESRWFRYDPMAMLAVVRHPSDLPRRGDGSALPDGEASVQPAWRYVGNFFRTGPYLCFSDTNPLEQQLGWLEGYRPAYLTALASHLEHLALVHGPSRPTDHLEVILSIAQQLTPAMEERIRRAFGATVCVNYGLNEIGIVATRCPEGGRYHVHAEHCIVEIVDDDGAPVAAGRPGRLVVTALRNAAMPLIRYDSGDIAESVAGDCPCGRTLPAFAGIRGRYRRMAFLPEGTWDFWVAVQTALHETPDHELGGLRQYQLHQYRDGSFDLRLDADGPLTPAFEHRMLEGWRHAARGAPPPALRFVHVRPIPQGATPKFENFTSDYFPAPDDTAA